MFHISAQNIDCEYSLEKPQRGGAEAVLTSTHNLCFWAEIQKIMYTSANPSFTIWKWGLRGSKLYRHVFVMQGGSSVAVLLCLCVAGFVCCGFFIVRRWFHIRRFFCASLVSYCVFVIYHSFGDSGRLCFMIVAFPAHIVAPQRLSSFPRSVSCIV